MSELTRFSTQFQEFLLKAPSAYHAVAQGEEELQLAGYTRLETTNHWVIAPGAKHFVSKGGALIAFTFPKLSTTNPDRVADLLRIRIVAAHTDSPTFKLKPSPDSITSDGWVQLGVEVYGSMLANSWLNRDLGLAGRLIDTEGNTHLIKTPPLLTIPQLAIHLDKDLKKQDCLHLDRQKHLLPLWHANLLTHSVREEPSSNTHEKQVISRPDSPSCPPVITHLSHLAGLDSDTQIQAHDLFTYDTQPPQLLGWNNQLLAASRLDNLTCTFACLQSLLASEISEETLQVVALFDNEEIGSQSPTGAQSNLLSRTLERVIQQVTGGQPQAVDRVLARSAAVSADVAHSVNPNYSDKHDLCSRPVMGRGPVLKTNANLRYSTTAHGIHLWKQATAHANVTSQIFATNNSQPCGSTIGPHIAANMGIEVIDAGIGILSMHSVRELCAPADLLGLTTTLKAFLR